MCFLIMTIVWKTFSYLISYRISYLSFPKQNRWNASLWGAKKENLRAMWRAHSCRDYSDSGERYSSLGADVFLFFVPPLFSVAVIYVPCFISHALTYSLLQFFFSLLHVDYKIDMTELTKLHGGMSFYAFWVCVSWPAAFLSLAKHFKKTFLSASAHQAVSCGACQTPVTNCEYEWHHGDPAVAVAQAHKHTYSFAVVHKHTNSHPHDF